MQDIEDTLAFTLSVLWTELGSLASASDSNSITGGIEYCEKNSKKVSLMLFVVLPTKYCRYCR